MREVDTPQLCQRCGKSMRTDGSGRITQWLSVCNCNLIRASAGQELSASLCSACGKRTRKGRSGSLTQWIFRADICSCDAPFDLETLSGNGHHPRRHLGGGDHPVDLTRPGRGEPADRRPHGTEGEEESSHEPSLDLDPETFPCERYQPISELGAGAAGGVYLCRDSMLRKKVAVKVLRTATDDQLLSFQNEARAISKLSHPEIIDILDFGVTRSGVPFMVLEYVPGISLRKAIDEEGPLFWCTALEIFILLAGALHYAHSKGVYHRDLKPSNILITDGDGEDDMPDGRIIDFGVANIKQETQEPTIFQGRTLVGTPAYMSPDQLKGFKFDERSEVYSLGCVLFETLTGTPPFQADTAMEVLAMQAQKDPPALSDVCYGGWPEMLEEILLTCLAKDRQERYASMDQLSAALRECLELEYSGSFVAGLASGDGFAGTEYATAYADGGSDSAVPVGLGLGLGLGPGVGVDPGPGAGAGARTTPGGKKLSAGGKVMIAVGLAAAMFVGGMAITDRMRLQGISPVEEASADGFGSEGSTVKLALDLNARLVDQDPFPKITYDQQTGMWNLTSQADLIVLRGLSQLLEKARVSCPVTPRPNAPLNITLPTSTVNGPEFEGLTGMPVYNLTIGESDVSDKQFEVLRSNSALNRINIGRAMNLTGKSMRTIASCPNIHVIDLHCQQLTPADLRPLEKCRNLTGLALGGMEIDAAMIDELQRFPSLCYLHIAKSPISEEALEKLPELKRMDNLAIDGRKLQPAQIELLKKCKHLRNLCLENCQLNDDFIRELSSMHRLRELKLKSCTGLSRDYLTKLTVALPRCDVSFPNVEAAEGLFGSETEFP